MAKEITREEAWALLTEYNKEPFHLKHGETVEGVMRWYAEKLGYGDEVDFWGIVGLLHDLDFEQFPEQHCIKSQEIMRERGLSERLIHATASHGYLLTVDIAPEHEMKKVLYAVDEHTVVEMVPQIPGQIAVDGSEQEAPARLKLVNFE